MAGSVPTVDRAASSVDRVAYSVTEFCASTGVGKTRFYAEVAAGRIRPVKCGSRTLIPASELQAWLERLAAQQRR